MLLNVTLILFHVSLLLFFFPLMLLYILEENIFFFINHCGVTTCGQTDQEPVKLSKVKVKYFFSLGVPIINPCSAEYLRLFFC